MKVTEKKIKKIFELHENNVSPKEIALEVGITEQWVRKLLKKGYPILTIKYQNRNAPTPVPSGYEPRSYPSYETGGSDYIDYPVHPSPDSILVRKCQRLEGKKLPH